MHLTIVIAGIGLERPEGVCLTGAAVGEACDGLCCISSFCRRVQQQIFIQANTCICAIHSQNVCKYSHNYNRDQQ